MGVDSTIIPPNDYLVVLEVRVDDGEPVPVAVTDLTVFRLDVEPPQITLPNDITLECPTDITPATTGEATATDPCGITSITHSDTTTSGCGLTETIIRTWTATDGCGNAASASQTIIVQDITTPVLKGIPHDQTVACDTIPEPPTVTATDTCDSEVVVEYNETRTSPEELCASVPLREKITRTWTATDNCGNTTTATQTITIEDTTPPVLNNIPPDETVSCDAIPDPPTVTATDTCDPDIVVEYNEVRTNPENLCASAPLREKITRTWTATDACGNTITASQTITVEDTTPPVLNNVPPDETVSCDAIPDPPTVTATDTCDNQVVVEYNEIRSNPEDLCTSAPLREKIIRTWTASDACGNTATATQTLNVEDTTPPVLNNVPPDETVSCDAIPDPPQVTATDTCDPQVVVEYNETRSNPEDLCASAPLREKIIRTWTASDACGNTTTATQTITVEDTTPPVLNGVPDDTTASCDAIPDPPQVTATDTCDSDIVVEYNETRSNPEDLCASAPLREKIIRTWTATDNCGNTITATQTINVEDTIPPVLNGVPDDTTVTCDAIPDPPQVTAIDTCDSDIVVDYNETRPNPEDLCASPPLREKITRTWTATDACGNTTTAIQTITIEDTTPPVLNGVPDDTTATCDAIPAPPVVTVTDTCDSDIVVDYNETRPNPEDLCASAPLREKIIRTWTATDNCGNTRTATQTITVEDTVPPVLNGVPDDATASCDTLPDPPPVTATDSCDSDVSIEFSETSSGSCPQTITRTWIASDTCENTTTATQSITVEDTTPPVLNNVPLDETVQCDAIPDPSEITATDTCDTEVSVEFSETLSGSCPQTITRTWTAADACGNTVTGTQTVTVEDTTAPVLSGVPVDTTVSCDAIPDPPEVTATDTCDSEVVVEFNETRTNPEDLCSSPPLREKITRTWTTTDNCGNTTTATQTISGEDTTPPTINCPDPATFNLSQADSDTCGIDASYPLLTDWLNSATANDSCGSSSLDHNAPPLLPTGTTPIQFTAKDECNNISSCSSNVTVIDDLPPAALAKDITIQLDDTGNTTIAPTDIENGSSDPCGIQNLTLDITAFDCTNIGDNTVNLTVTDNNGNTTSASAIVTVQDTTAATVLTQDITVYLDNTGNVPLKAADIDNNSFDACGIASFALNRPSFDCSNIGDKFITLTVTDNQGNTASNTAVVTVVDTVPPVVITQDISIELGTDIPLTITPETIDNGSSDACDIASLTLDPSTFDYHHLGMNTVTLTAIDTNGNSSSGTAKVTVTDTTGPYGACSALSPMRINPGNSAKNQICVVTPGGGTISRSDLHDNTVTSYLGISRKIFFRPKSKGNSIMVNGSAYTFSSNNTYTIAGDLQLYLYNNHPNHPNAAAMGHWLLCVTATNATVEVKGKNTVTDCSD